MARRDLNEEAPLVRTHSPESTRLIMIAGQGVPPAPSAPLDRWRFLLLQM